jgi:translation initiation factor IF-3
LIERGLIKRSRRQTKRVESVDYRINRQIRVREVRVVDQNGVHKGIMPTYEALRMAEDANLDLVEVSPNAEPPVARILDYGKFSYEQTKKEREARKHQKKVGLTPRTDSFHREIGVRTARKWLGEGKKVKFMVRFKAREISYPEIGQRALQEIAEELSDVAIVEQQPTLEGWRMTLTLSPELAAVAAE